MPNLFQGHIFTASSIFYASSSFGLRTMFSVSIRIIPMWQGELTQELIQPCALQLLHPGSFVYLEILNG